MLVTFGVSFSGTKYILLLCNKHQSHSVSHTALSMSPYPRAPVSLYSSSVTMNPTSLWHRMLSIILLILLSLAYFSQHAGSRLHLWHGMCLNFLLLQGGIAFHYPSLHFVYPTSHLAKPLYLACLLL